MTNRSVLVVVVLICIDVYGAVDYDDFRGTYTTADGWHMSSGFPDNVHPKDCSPSNIRIEHITPLLEIYERNLRKGTLPAAIKTSATFETLYLFSFVGDERFSSLIYDQYAERLFKEFGHREASSVLLYYKTGGSLEKLRTLYQQPVSDVIKSSIEACFFDAAVCLLENHEQDAVDAITQPLSIKLSIKPRKKSNTTESVGGTSASLFGEPFAVSEDDAHVYSCKTDERDLYIEYENTTKNMLIQIKIPGSIYRRCWCEFNAKRNDGIPVCSREYGRVHEHDSQLVTLYPQDRYIRRVDLNFSVEDPGHIAAQLFSDFGKYGVALNDYWVGNAEDEFSVTLDYKCNYIVAKSVGDLNNITDSDWKEVRSTSVELRYIPSKGSKTRTDKEKDWESVMMRWEGIP